MCLCLWDYLHHVRARRLQKRMWDPLGTGVTGGWELPCGADNWTQVLCRSSGCPALPSHLSSPLSHAYGKQSIYVGTTFPSLLLLSLSYLSILLLFFWLLVILLKLKSSKVMVCFYPDRLGAVEPGWQPGMIPHQVPTEQGALPRRQPSGALFCLLEGFFFFSNTFYASALVAVGGIQGTWRCSILL